MAVELKIPSVGESVNEVMIGNWLVKEREGVERDQPVVEIESDKATVELPAPEAGQITQILKQSGDMAEVGEVVGYMEPGQGGATASSASAAAASQQEAPEAAKPERQAASEGTTSAASSSAASSGGDGAGGPSATSAGESAPPAAQQPAASQSVESQAQAPQAQASEAQAPQPEGRPAEAHAGGEQSGPPVSAEEARIMPSARRLLVEKGLDVSDVRATGPGGRVLKEDVQRHRPADARAPQVEPPAAPRSPDPGQRAGQPATQPAKDAKAAAGERQERVVNMTPMRRRIAERLVEAQQTGALLTTFNEIDMSAVMKLRKAFQDEFVEKYGLKLGFMSFFVRACVEALKEFPQANAQIHEQQIVYYDYYDIGIAVGAGKGLVVPIIRNAEKRSFGEIEQTIADFVNRAQNNKIALEELQGGTFSISNGGVYGSLLSTPIINPPQSGILGMHKIEDRVVAVNGEVAVRPMMYVALTYDHRIVDGREAVTFLVRIKERIERPERLFLEI